MKFFIIFACTLAAVSAHVVAPVAPVYAGTQHFPVIGPNGVPVDTVEVQHARAAHLAHKFEAHARNGDYAVAAVAPLAYAHHAGPLLATAAHQTYAAPVVSTYAAPYAYGDYYGHHAAYPTSAVLPTSINGVPLETPEVVAAKSDHFAAHAEALSRSSPIHLYRKKRGIYAAAPLAYSAAYTYPALAHAAYSYGNSVVNPYAYGAHLGYYY